MNLHGLLTRNSNSKSLSRRQLQSRSSFDGKSVIYLFTYLPIHPSIYLLFYLSIYLSSYLPICLFILYIRQLDSLEDHIESCKRSGSDRFHRDGSPEKMIKVTNSFSSRVSSASSSTYSRQHRRCYSTGTKYNGTTISSPDNDATITCVCMTPNKHRNHRTTISK